MANIAHVLEIGIGMVIVTAIEHQEDQRLVEVVPQTVTATNKKGEFISPTIIVLLLVEFCGVFQSSDACHFYRKQNDLESFLQAQYYCYPTI
jgi:hypothetical protein